MKYDDMESLSLYKFSKDDKDALFFIEKLAKDESIKKWFSGIFVGLLNNPNNEFFDHSFLVKSNDIYVGYIKIGKYNEEEKCVYLTAAIDKDLRGHSYGKTLLTETTEYIFQNHPQVESIRLKIDNNNKASLMTANSCGYRWLKDDYYMKENPYLKKVKM